MRNNKRMALVIVMLLALSIGGAAQSKPDSQTDPQKARPRTTTSGDNKDKKPVVGDRLEPDDTSRTPSDVSDDMQANRQEQLSEQAAITPYYNNFFNTYRLGPEDVISVDVFNQPRYSRSGITIPPSGRVSLSLIPGGVFVNGKTVEQVAEIITKKYNEYIIEPQVTVSLDKAASYRYSVIGDVGQPGIRLMNHRMTVTEAIAEAGGVLTTGDKGKVVVLRRQSDGMLAQIPVNLSAIYKGKTPDTTFLVPGDQIVVPGNKLKRVRELLSFTSVLSFGRIFGLPTPY
ncbi:MAG TPA: polysaccharide biosynthesis/export family protein [Pyrinomonadaceae bacterium]|nr:polysaccharide biosynthesis/export family protein [Pyrinomonadaceae bacterium]